MEAAALLSLPPGFCFNPDDEVIVEHYLVARLQGRRHQFSAVLIDDDPFSAPPWELLRRHRRKDDEAFFVAAGHALSHKDSRQSRIVAGGKWKGQKVRVGDKKLRARDTGVEIRFRKYNLNYHAAGESGSSGWVMDEYAVTAPPDLAASPLRLYSVRFSGHGQKRKKEPQDSGDVDDDRAGSRPCHSHSCVEESSVSESVVVDPIPATAATSQDEQGCSATAITETGGDSLDFTLMEDLDGALDYFHNNPHELYADNDTNIVLPVMEDPDGAASMAAAGTSTSESDRVQLLEDMDMDELMKCFTFENLDDIDIGG